MLRKNTFLAQQSYVVSDVLAFSAFIRRKLNKMWGNIQISIGDYPTYMVSICNGVEVNIHLFSLVTGG